MLLAGLALALTACTGIPTSSAPQVIQPVHIGASASPAISPTPGEAPLSLVQGFLQAGAADPSGTTSARSFLTTSARVQWAATSVTIIDNPQYVPYDRSTGYVGVTGQQVAQINANGVYLPVQGSFQSQFHVTLVDGQYRIDKLPSGLGLLLTSDEFRNAFHQYPIYFYDLNDQYLVPDYRWTAFSPTDLTDLVQWEVGQLVSGPRPSMVNTVNQSYTLPSGLGTSNSHVVVTSAPNDPLEIEIPGSSQLAGDVRNRLAAQLCQMVAAIQPSGPVMEITDSKVPVEIPAVRSSEFTQASFPTKGLVPPTPPVGVYYLASGQLRTGNGSPVAGALGRGQFYLDSVALHPAIENAQTLLVAGVAGQDDELAVGTEDLGLRVTNLKNVTTRPTFDPGTDEVWVGVGKTLERATISGQSATIASVPIQSLTGPVGSLGVIKAVRMSPEGARIALIVAGPNNTTQLYVGAVVRQNNQVHVQGLSLLSPSGAVLQDVAWSDGRRLVAVGYDGSAQNQRVYDVGVDGSDWTEASTTLAGQLTSVTVAPSQPVWVSTETDGVSYIWQQISGGWRAPVKAQTQGGNPVYVE